MKPKTTKTYIIPLKEIVDKFGIEIDMTETRIYYSITNEQLEIRTDIE